jgi:hypothetical protein
MRTKTTQPPPPPSDAQVPVTEEDAAPVHASMKLGTPVHTIGDAQDVVVTPDPQSPQPDPQTSTDPAPFLPLSNPGLTREQALVLEAQGRPR